MLALANKLSITTQPIYRFVNKYSVQFDGSDQRIVTDGADTVAQNTTYSFWAKSSTTAENLGVFGHGAQQMGAFHFNFLQGGTNKPLLWLGNSYYVFWNDISQQDDGEWHHWVVYSDPNNLSNCKLYCDGVLQTVNVVVTSGSLMAYTESLTIGSDEQVGGNSFEGKIDEFAVFDRELTQAEITRMFNTYYSPNRVANGNFSQEGVEEVTNGDLSQIGSELIVNSDFSSNTWWTVETPEAEISNGKVNFNTTLQNYGIFKSSLLTSSKQYKVVFTIDSYTSGGVHLNIGGSVVNSYTATGTYTAYVTGGGTNVFGIQSDSGGAVLSIDNVSVKEVGQNWSFGTGWSMGNGKAVRVASSSTDLVQASVFPNLTSIFKISFDVVRSAGSVRLRAGTLNLPYVSATDTYTYYVTPTSNDQLKFQADSSFVGSIDNITVKEVGQHWTFGTGWSTDGTKAIYTAGGSQYSQLEQIQGLNSGATYKVLFDLVDTDSLGVYVRLCGGSWSALITGTGSKELSSVAGSGNQIEFEIGGAYDTKSLSIDNIVVQELKHDATNLMLNAGAYQSANPLITSTKSMEFDPTDYLSVSDSDDLDIGTNDFSVSAWVKTTVADGTVLAKRNGSVSGGAGYEMGLSNGKVSWYFKDAAGNAAFDTEDTVTVNDGKWHHIAWVFDRSGLGYRYIDGVNSGTNDSLTGAVGSLANTDVALGIGARIQASADNFFTGKITEAGIYNRALTSLEVASLYNQGMPTNLLVNRNNYQSGNPTVFNTKQVDFDGTDDYINAGNVLNLGTSDFSISMWVNSSQTTNRIMGKTQDDANRWYIRSTGNKVQFHSKSGGAVTMNLTTTETFPVDTWAHLLISADRDGTVYIYINGVQSSVTASGSATSLDNTGDLTIGKVTFFDSYFDGKISQVGMWNKALTANEVSSLYNHGLPIDLTTDQAAYESSSNLVGYWRMGSGTLDTYPLIADQTNATLGSELLSQPVDLQTDFTNNSGGVIVDADTFTTSGGTLDGIVTSISTTIGKTYKLTVEGNTTSSGFTFGSANGTGREYGSGFGTHYFTALHANIWVRQSTAGTTNITSFTLKQVQGNPAMMINLGGGADFSDGIKNGSPYANTVTNGTFDTDSDWTKETGWTISGGTANYSGGSSNRNIRQAIGITNGKTYKIQYQVTAITSGEVACRFGGMSGVNEITATNTGTYVGYITANSSANGELLIEDNDNNFVGSIDNVTVEEVNTGLQGYWKMGDGTNDEYPVIYDQVDPTLSSELVTNGDFATDLSGWSGQAGRGSYAWDNGRAKITNDDASSYPNLSQSINTNIGKVYKITATVEIGTATLTEVRAYSNSNIGSQQLTTDGTIEFYITADDTDFTLHLYLFETGNTGHYCYFDNVSVKEVQGNPAYMTNMVEGNITNQYPLTKIRNYYRMGDGILDGYPIIQDQTSPNLAHIPTTNLVTLSEDFNTYRMASSSVTPNSIIAPDGTNTGTLVTQGTNQLVLRASNVVETNKTYTFSCYVKSSGSNITSVTIDISDGPLSTHTLTNDWQRISVTSEVTKTPQSTYNFVDIATNGSQGDTFYTWGWQVEEQNQATAYIKSDGIAAVRKSSTTNLIPYSEDFENAAWSISELSFGSKVTSPIGTNDAITIIETDATAQHNIYDEIVGFTNEAHTLSCYAKLGTSNNRGIFLRVRDGNTSGTSYGIAWYNLSDGTFTMSGGISANIENVGNGWYRCSLTVTAPSGSSYCLIGLANGNSNYYDGDGTSNVLIWGSQVEKQTQAETYAKTTGLPVTIDLFTENNYGTMTNMSASDIVEDTPNN